MKSDIKKVALVGYTNAGKSSIMNKIMEMSGSEVENRAFAEDMLFATLDPFNKKITLDDNLSFILSDTVGFVRKLPHTLVEAFKSTLEEVLMADYLIYVVDVSNDNYEYQLNVTFDVVKELGGHDIPFMVAYNKIDKLPEGEADKRGNAVFDFVDISAIRGDGMDTLLEKIKSHVAKEEKLVKVVLPYSEGGLHSFLLENNRVLGSEYGEEGIEVEVYLKPSDMGKFEKYIVD